MVDKQPTISPLSKGSTREKATVSDPDVTQLCAAVNRTSSLYGVTLAEFTKVAKEVLKMEKKIGTSLSVRQIAAIFRRDRLDK